MTTKNVAQEIVERAQLREWIKKIAAVAAAPAVSPTTASGGLPRPATPAPVVAPPKPSAPPKPAPKPAATAAAPSPAAPSSRPLPYAYGSGPSSAAAQTAPPGPAGRPMHLSRIENVKAPAQYRGKGEIGGIGWTPERDRLMKTWDQLNQEQGITANPALERNRYGVISNGLSQLKGGLLGTGAAALNLAGTVAGRPLAWAGDTISGLVGGNPGLQEGLNDHLVGLQDLRDRGLHQARYPNSRALDDSIAATGEEIARQGPESGNQTVYNASAVGADVVPSMVGVTGLTNLAGGALKMAPGAARVMQSANAAKNALPPAAQTALNVWGHPATQMAGYTGASMIADNAARHGDTSYAQWAFPSMHAPVAALQLAEDRTTSDNVSGATTSFGPNGEMMVNTPGQKPVPLSQLSPEQAHAVMQDPNAQRDLQFSAATGGEIPNSVKTPSERVLSGTAEDPLKQMQSAPPQANQASGPRLVLNTEEIQSAPGDAPLGHVSENEASEAFFANPDLFEQDEAAAVREYRANKKQQAAAPTPEQANQVGESLAAANSPDATPEQKQVAQQDFQKFMQQQIAANPKHRQGAKDLMSGADTPQAKEFRAHLEATGNDVMDAELKRLYAQNPNPTPEQAGGFYAQAANAWNSLGTPGQVMVGLGAGAGLVALLMSLMGGGGEGGGMGGMLAAILGLGAAGLGLAGSGAFGQGGQDFVGDMIGSVGQASGLIPKQLTADQKALLTAKDPIAAAMAQSGGLMTREQAAKKIQDAKTQLGQLGMLNSLGGMQNSIYQRMGLTPEEAQLAAKNTGLLTKAYNDQNSALNAKLRYGAEYADPNKSGWGGDALNTMAHGWNWLRGKQGSENMNIAQQIWMQHQMMKAARCWAGYEPVPGKAPYSNDSCRPKGSGKKKDDKKEKKAEEASAGASHFSHAKKELEPVVNGQKPSTENSKQHKVEPKKPETGENLHPSASLMQSDTKPKAN